MLVGDDPGSHWYVAAKHKDCAEIGIESIRRDLPATATQAEVEAVIDELNADPSCTGFLVQQPTGLDEFALLSRVDPDKDVDGLHPVNLGKLVLGEPGSLPCTPIGCIELLRRHGVEIEGAEVTVLGRGLTVGRPLGLLLTRKSENATVTLCHTRTRDLAAHTRNADIVVAAAGVPGIITGDMVKPGAAVLDVGVSRVDGKIAGDVADDVWDVAGWVSPNPGGVGPMTRAMLLSNLVLMAERAGDFVTDQPPPSRPSRATRRRRAGRPRRRRSPRSSTPSRRSTRRSRRNAATRRRSAVRSTCSCSWRARSASRSSGRATGGSASVASPARSASPRCCGWCCPRATRACSPYATGSSTRCCSAGSVPRSSSSSTTIPDQPV